MQRSCVVLLVFLAVSVGTQARSVRPRYKRGTYVDAKGMSRGHGHAEGTGTVTSDENGLSLEQSTDAVGESGSRVSSKVRSHGRDARGLVKAVGSSKTRGKGMTNAQNTASINEDGGIGSTSVANGMSQGRGRTRSKTKGSAVSEDERADSRASTRTRGNSEALSSAFGDDISIPGATSQSASQSTGGRSQTRGSARYRSKDVDVRARSGSTSSGNAMGTSSGSAFRSPASTEPIIATSTTTAGAGEGKARAHGTSTFKTKDGESTSSRGSSVAQGRDALTTSVGIGTVSDSGITAAGASSARATDSYASGQHHVVSRRDGVTAVTRDKSTVRGTGESSTSGEASSTDEGTTVTSTANAKSEGGYADAEQKSSLLEG